MQISASVKRDSRLASRFQTRILLPLGFLSAFAEANVATTISRCQFPSTPSFIRFFAIRFDSVSTNRLALSATRFVRMVLPMTRCRWRKPPARDSSLRWQNHRRSFSPSNFDIRLLPVAPLFLLFLNDGSATATSSSIHVASLYPVDENRKKKNFPIGACWSHLPNQLSLGFLLIRTEENEDRIWICRSVDKFGTSDEQLTFFFVKRITS